MNIRRIATLVWGLIIIVSSNIVMMPTSAAPATTESEIGFTLPQQQIVTQLQTANVVYLGETHDLEWDHQQVATNVKV